LLASRVGLVFIPSRILFRSIWMDLTKCSMQFTNILLKIATALSHNSKLPTLYKITTAMSHNSRLHLGKLQGCWNWNEL